MRRIWVVVVALAWVVLAAEARADTVYLTNGQSIWGREAYEEGDSVVVERPGGDLRIPKSQVDRIERTQSTLPPSYAPPGTAPAGGPSTPPTGSAAAPQSARMILALGSTGFLDPRSIQAATGAEVQRDLEKFQLKDFSIVVLANIAFPALPGPVQQGLVQYVNDGGAVLITGGAQSFGSGGYEAVASIIPFQIRSASDWRFIPFRSPVPLQPGHPILAGVTFITVGNLNDMIPRGDATEILQAAGGGSAGAQGTGGGGSYPYPLIAELAVGTGRVIGIAFDLNEFAGMRDCDLFVKNTIGYLLNASRIGPPTR